MVCALVPQADEAVTFICLLAWAWKPFWNTTVSVPTPGLLVVPMTVTLVGGTVQLKLAAPADVAVYVTCSPVWIAAHTFTNPVTTGAAPLATLMEAAADTGAPHPVLMV